MKKRLGYILLLLLVATSVWYFFVKEYDYLVTFETKNAPGIVYNKLLNWNQGRATKDEISIIQKVPFSQVQLEIAKDDSKTFMDWQFQSISDSVTKVKVYFKDQDLINFTLV